MIFIWGLWPSSKCHIILIDVIYIYVGVGYFYWYCYRYQSTFYTNHADKYYIWYMDFDSTAIYKRRFSTAAVEDQCVSSRLQNLYVYYVISSSLWQAMWDVSWGISWSNLDSFLYSTGNFEASVSDPLLLGPWKSWWEVSRAFPSQVLEPLLYSNCVGWDHIRSTSSLRWCLTEASSNQHITNLR